MAYTDILSDGTKVEFSSDLSQVKVNGVPTPISSLSGPVLQQYKQRVDALAYTNSDLYKQLQQEILKNPEYQSQVATSQEQAVALGKEAKGKALAESWAGTGLYTEEQIRRMLLDKGYAAEAASKYASENRLNSGDPTAGFGLGGESLNTARERIATNQDKLPQWQKDLFYPQGLPEFAVDTQTGGFTKVPDPNEFSDTTRPNRGGIGEAQGQIDPSLLIDQSLKIINGLSTELPIGALQMPDIAAPAADANLFDTSKFEITPEQTAPNQLAEQANMETFDKVKRKGSFEIVTNSDRPFGGSNPTEAFIKPNPVNFQDLGVTKKGNTVFRWA